MIQLVRAITALALAAVAALVPAAPHLAAPAPAHSAATANTRPAATTPPSGTSSTETWARAKSALFTSTSRGGGTAKGGTADARAEDGRALRLSIPKNAGAGTDHAAEVTSKAEFTYGVVTARVRTADCSAQPRTGAVTGIFTYGNDGADHDGDGIVDNSELDVEVLCARPSELHLTIWTDYDSGGDQRRVTRVVDLAAGRVAATCFFTDWDVCRQVSAAERSPATVAAVPGFDSSAAYHDYRIEWRADRVVFGLADPGAERTLWDYRGPKTRIPTRPSTFRTNVWHTDDWTPEAAPEATRAPSAKLSVLVDRTTVAP